MKLIDNLRKELESVGAKLDDKSGAGYDLYCDAPSGYVWSANGCTTISIHYATNSQSWLAKELREDAYPQLKLGLEKVTDQTEIERYRWDLDDDTWGAKPEDPDKIAWPKKVNSA